MTLHRSTCIPAPEFSHRETKEPVPPQGTLERLLLRTEQTGWSVVYGSLSLTPCLYSTYVIRPSVYGTEGYWFESSRVYWLTIRFVTSCPLIAQCRPEARSADRNLG